MKKFVLMSVVAILLASSASAEVRWSYLAVSNLFSAVSWAGSGGNDAKPPVIVATGHPKAPFVVYRYTEAPTWENLPTFYESRITHPQKAWPLYRQWRRDRSTDNTGMVTMPDGYAIVWRTIEAP